MSRRPGSFSRLVRHSGVRLMKAAMGAAVLTALMPSSLASAEEFPEYKARATFIYHLADNVEWNTKPVSLCTFGYDAATQHLEKLSQLPEHKVEVKRNVSLEDIATCRILYVSKAGSRVLPEIIEESRKGKVLTISDIENFTLVGGMMRFEIIRNRVSLKANKQAIQAAGIRLAPSLLNILKEEQQ